jgi:signal transduction histidine kinase
MITVPVVFELLLRQFHRKAGLSSVVGGRLSFEPYIDSRRQYTNHMIRHSRQLVAAFMRPPNLEHVHISRHVMWAGLLSVGLPCTLLLIIGIISGRLVANPALYAALVVLYLGLLLLIYIPSQISRMIWQHLWAYLIVLGLICLGIQSLVEESFLQPIIFLVPPVFAALAYPGGRVALVDLFLLGLMNLGIWNGGQHEPIAFLFPTFGYGTFMVFTYAFIQLSIQQSIARQEADRLARDLARQRDYLARLVQITATLTRDLDLTTVLEQVAAEGRLLAQADQAGVWLRDDDDDTELSNGRVRLAAIVPEQQATMASTTKALWEVESIEQLRPEASSARLVLPLVFKGATIGALELRATADAAFSADDAQLLQPFADAAAVAIENARLFAQSRLSATLSERNRLARELHDTIAQGLTAVTMQLEAAQRGFERDPARTRARLARAHELSRDTLEDVRRSVWTLAAPLVDGSTFSAVLQDLTARFTERTGLQIHYTHSGDRPELGHAAATQVLRIVQEALQNVEKHAEATHVRVGSAVGQGTLRVWVYDNGIGFAESSVSADKRGTGFGLISLHERARLAGGRIEIESAPGEGTKVTVSIDTA